jgi:anhydro-N-acetylmuramic acid kinase
MDGVDAALIETDGEVVTEFGPTAFVPYNSGFVECLRTLLCDAPEKNPHYDHIVGELTALHGDAVDALLGDNAISSDHIDVIGFHGQTVHHAPADKLTIQIGDACALAQRTRIKVVGDFRHDDVAAGGQGAPLAPIFHRAIAIDLDKPLAIINIGGVSNVTLLGAEDYDILAFDTGPGNALIDDWVYQATGQSYDIMGKLASSGTVDRAVLAHLMDHEYFDQPPPKSLDRNEFDPAPVAGLSLEDGAATLVAFSAQTIARGCALDGFNPVRWLVCGGGRHNQTLMSALEEASDVPVEPVEAVGWQGDALEAQAFAFLAVRVLQGLVTSLPSTTGVTEPVCGGSLFPVKGF